MTPAKSAVNEPDWWTLSSTAIDHCPPDRRTCGQTEPLPQAATVQIPLISIHSATGQPACSSLADIELIRLPRSAWAASDSVQVHVVVASLHRPTQLLTGSCGDPRESLEIGVVGAVGTDREHDLGHGGPPLYFSAVHLK